MTERFYAALDELEAARPTAVNLSWAISEMKEVYSHSESLETAGAELLNKAKTLNIPTGICAGVLVHTELIYLKAKLPLTF